MSEIVGRKTIDDLFLYNEDTAPEDTKIPVNIDGVTYKITLTQLIKQLSRFSFQRPPGELVYSTIRLPDNDGLHLANGELLDVHGKYRNFYEYMLDRIRKGYTQAFTTEEEWQQEVSDYGFCPKYVLVEDESIRLPLIKGYNKSTTDINEIGIINEAGLPNITGGFYANVQNRNTQTTGAFYQSASTNSSTGSTGGDYRMGYGFEASLSNPIYGNSDTVQPEGYNTLVYIVIGTAHDTTVEILQEYEVANTVPLGCPIWSDHKLEDINYLYSNDQWNDGLMYSDFYDELLLEYNDLEAEDKTETINGVVINYRLTPRGFKIVDETQTGIDGLADYGFSCFVLDSDNNRFKLPLNTKKVEVDGVWKIVGYLYYKVGNAVENINRIDLNRLINVTDELKEFIKNYDFMDDTFYRRITPDLEKRIDIASHYTAIDNGNIRAYADGTSVNTYGYVLVNGLPVENFDNDGGGEAKVNIIVKKGDEVVFVENRNSLPYKYFFPFYKY